MLNVNEIVVKADQKPGKVSFYNFDELKSYMKKGLAIYNKTVYAPDNLDKAERDLKDLKAIKKKLSDTKKELETAYSLPIEEVKKQLDELIDMVKEPLDLIDGMIKDNAKKIKEKEIMAYAKKEAKSLGEYANNVLKSSAFFNDRWLNVTYKTKDWQSDIDNIISNAASALKTINSIGGKKKGALLGFYFDKLSLEGAEEFLELASEDVINEVSDIEDENAVVGYKVLKISGTERQILQLMTMLDLSDMEVEEIEDGMPKDMEELSSPSFDTFVSFDIEHTGTFGVDNGDAPAEITEIGAVKVVDGKIVDKFDMLANPGRKIVPRVAKLTNITDEMLANEAPVSEVVAKFKEFVGDSILVGHNIKSCDIPHITRAAKRAGIVFENDYLDTNVLARKLKEKKKWENTTLSYLAKQYKVKQTDTHRAWCDAEANAYVYMKLKEEK